MRARVGTHWCYQGIEMLSTGISMCEVHWAAGKTAVL